MSSWSISNHPSLRLMERMTPTPECVLTGARSSGFGEPTGWPTWAGGSIVFQGMGEADAVAVCGVGAATFSAWGGRAQETDSAASDTNRSRAGKPAPRLNVALLFSKGRSFAADR